MPIPASRLLTIVTESESALYAYRELAATVRASITAYTTGLYTPSALCDALRAALADIPAPTGEATAVERAYWTRNAGPAAARRAAANAKRINAALALGHDPDARAVQTAPQSIVHAIGPQPQWLTPPKAGGGKANDKTNANHINATHTTPTSTFQPIPDTPPLALSPPDEWDYSDIDMDEV